MGYRVNKGRMENVISVQAGSRQVLHGFFLAFCKWI